MTSKISIQEARERAGMTLGDAALAAGITREKMGWYEDNPSEIEGLEAIALCKLYGIKLNEVDFCSKSDKAEPHKIYLPSRRLTFLLEMKKNLSTIMLSVTDDGQYSENNLLEDLIDLLNDVGHEEEAIMNELEAGIVSIKSENHLNLSLAGR
ncbi:DNA-binding XRE family transcriptional regulator [Paenibacillus sp. LBL]|uniref:helix-turn-helix domain-containing protein n=1 Tax=Paenibacillus sp. LBL TaxID=2940563 RepID=UPI002473AE30|nr:helix-turn-helix transcriptional regulator [Paenibacillus sp. LBL]MDH6673194.1 DNA-binding XRE family transcriptional regulator [Paenibacillus sp. LBL]